MSDAPLNPHAEPTGERALQRARAIRRWRRVQGIGGLLLASCFFLPAISSCNANLVPYQEMTSIIDTSVDEIAEQLDSWYGVFDFLMGCAIYSATYTLGLLIALSVLTKQPTKSRFARVCSFAVRTIQCAVALCVLGMIATESTSSLWPPKAGAASAYITVGIAIITPVYLIWSARHKTGAQVCNRLWCALCCVIWFTFWTVQGALIGVHLALLGSLLILVGAVVEAKLLCRRSFWFTLKSLATANLTACETEYEICAQCGYLLIGLTQPRCPECGTPCDPSCLVASNDLTHA